MTPKSEQRMAGQRRLGVTPLSAFGATWKAEARAEWLARCGVALARLSLLMFTMTFAAGCLDTPPDYSEPSRIPPVIIMGQVDPPPTSLHVVDSSPYVFTVYYRADDGGKRLQAVFVLDLEIGTPEPVSQIPIAPDPRPFADQRSQDGRGDRWVENKWPWNNGDPRRLGCHTMTAIISDSDNFTGFYQTNDALTEARVTWFLWIQDPAAQQQMDPASLETCFQRHPSGATP